MWECQVCHRKFKHTNQEHSCLVVPMEHHFSERPLALETTVRRILNQVELFGNVKVSSVKNAILIASASTFLALKVKKDRVEVEFLLKEAKEGFPVYKVVKISKNRVVHFVAVGSPEEVDESLMGLFREAYEIAK